jgi:hypothetical protein
MPPRWLIVTLVAWLALSVVINVLIQAALH